MISFGNSRAPKFRFRPHNKPLSQKGSFKQKSKSKLPHDVELESMVTADTASIVATSSAGPLWPYQPLQQEADMVKIAAKWR